MVTSYKNPNRILMQRRGAPNPREKKVLPLPDHTTSYTRTQTAIEQLVRILHGEKLSQRPFEMLPKHKQEDELDQVDSFVAWRERRGELRF